jgi:multidrug efflux pump subunit AcrB
LTRPAVVHAPSLVDHWRHGVLMFVLSVFGMGLVQNQFFPASDRPEILVDLNLPQNASIQETLKVTQRFEASLKGDPDIVRWSTYIGEGAIRFYLPLDQQLQNPFFAQLVIVSTGLESRDALMERLEQTPARRFCGRRQLCAHPGTGAARGPAAAIPGERPEHRSGAQTRD